MLTTNITTAGPPAMPATLRYIENGDALNTGNHLIQAEDVAQGLGHLKATKLDTTETRALTLSDVTLSGTNKLKLASRSIVRHQSMSGGSTSADWEQFSGDLRWRNTSQGGTVTILLDRLPHGGVLDSVTVRWRGAAGHGGLPSPMPSIEVCVLTEGSELLGGLGSANDASADVTAYETLHSITVSGLAETIDLTANRYFVVITGEGATNFVANASVRHVKVSCTVTSYSEY